MPDCSTNDSNSQAARDGLWRDLFLLSALLASGGLFQKDGLRAQSLDAASPRAANAANEPTPNAQPALQTPPTPFWTNRGRWTFGFQAGYALENAIPRNISHINLLVAQPQLGFIAWDSPGSRLPARRFEVLSEGFLGNAVHPGGRVTGQTLLFRLDGKPRGSLVPFFDMGAGVLDTTLHSRAPELSGQLQFTPQGGVGLQYFFNPQRAIVFEYRYMHMSNASIEPPNHGFNSSMITVGVRWLRRAPRPPALNPSSHRSHNPFRLLFGAD